MAFRQGKSFHYLQLAVTISCLQQGWAGMEFICGRYDLTLSMAKVCDNVWDCADGSDELPSHICPPIGPGESVVITSPGWPGKYPNNASVTWTFAAARGLPLLLKIAHFNVERDYDFLIIGGASDPSDMGSVMTYHYGHNKYTRQPFEMFANLTGNDDLLTQHVWRSEVSELWMYFESDFEVTRDGFEMVLYTPEDRAKTKDLTPEAPRYLQNWGYRTKHFSAFTWNLMSIKLTANFTIISLNLVLKLARGSRGYDNAFVFL